MLNFNRLLIFVFLVSLTVFTSSVYAVLSDKRQSSLNNLFYELKNAESEADAMIIEEQIWNLWLEAEDVELNKLMQQVLDKMRVSDFDAAIEICNKIIELKPDYAEAWNKRATIYFQQRKYEESLVDIAKTLELEPRHFGAMAGRALIRIRQVKVALARQSIIQAMEIHPYLRQRFLFPDLVTDVVE